VHLILTRIRVIIEVFALREALIFFADILAAGLFIARTLQILQSIEHVAFRLTLSIFAIIVAKVQTSVIALPRLLEIFVAHRRRRERQANRCQQVQHFFFNTEGKTKR